MAFLSRSASASALAAIVALACAGGFSGLAAVAGPAPAIANTEAVYAAFTLNLTRFVSWPASAFASPTAPLVIGTFPRDRINRELDAAIAGEVVNGHPVETIRLHSLDEVAKCHVVYISKNVFRPSAVLERCRGQPILTIGDADGFLELGGHVRFVPQPPHIRLSISAVNLRESGLEARAQLLRLASTP
jgi:hypothetical protein